MEQQIKKRILILGNNDVGLYQFRKELIFELLNSNCKIIFSVPNGDMVEPLIEMGCKFVDTPIERRGFNPIKDVKLFLNYIKMIRKQKPDIVITYTIKPNIYGGMACILNRIPYAVNITGLGTAFQKNAIIVKFVTFMYKIALKKANVVFFENSENMNTFLDKEIVKKTNACLLSGAGVNLQHFSYLTYPSTKTTRFLFVGRVMREKGIEELLSSMQHLLADGEDCVLDIVGPYEDDYEQKLKELSSQGWLNCYGYKKDVRSFIKNAHCFVLPSWHEGMANTNLESASSGRPVITCNIPGCRESVIDGKSGFLCERKNAESLYNVMKHFMRLSYEERENMGKAGRLHMESVFDKNKVVENTIRELRGIK